MSLDETLRAELLAMVERDQALRARYIAGEELSLEEWLAVDGPNTERLKQIVATHGWPGCSLVGKDGAHAAWLLAQHAVHDRPFQKSCLALLEEAVKKGEAERKDLAYLIDRDARLDGRKQIYGTQFDENNEPEPIEDEANVDERRRAVGLDTLAEGRERIWRTYGPPRSR